MEIVKCKFREVMEHDSVCIYCIRYTLDNEGVCMRFAGGENDNYCKPCPWGGK